MKGAVFVQNGCGKLEGQGRQRQCQGTACESACLVLFEGEDLGELGRRKKKVIDLQRNERL